ncbi:tetratricopeptide repeat protein [Streptomyces sp. WAC 06738]|uniref:tetratricopeptide repeat protein n=1 Tax=Streptomyces sp. WAC 06738 TaxID=2203210 RepID=UPI0013DEC42D|nr:tetratricopeptide repeat protein [Streptomyces sp. WAC 06738]
MGKTSLALSWLHSRSEDFPDGQLYAELEGHRDQPTGPDQVLPRFLQALGVHPEHVPVDLAGQVAHFRTVTAGRRIAVLCDNALSAAQVRPLMPASAGGVCVVTSRWYLRSLVLDGAEVVQLDPLDTDSAMELLGNLAGHDRVAADPATARALVTSCGRFPLAVVVSAALFTDRPGWSLSTALTGPAAHPYLTQTEEVSMETRFDEVYRTLPEDAARLYCRMSLHPGSEFDTGVAEAAAAAPPEIPAPADSLEALVHANLLGTDSPGRYRFHDLVHEHARQRGEADDDVNERDRVVQRIINHYLATANSADHVVYPQRRRPEPEYLLPPQEPRTFADFATALGWLDDELGNLMGVQRLAAEYGHQSAAWQLADAMWGLFIHKRYYQEWITSYELGVSAAKACGHHLGEARLRNGLGVALREAGRYAEAHGAFGCALLLRMELGDLRGEALVLHNMGLLCLQRDDEPNRAGHWFREALDIREQVSDTRGIAREHSAIGEVESRLGHHEDAIRHLTRAMDMIEGTGDLSTEIPVRRRLGQAYLRAGDRPAARTHLETALEALSDAGTVFDRGTLHELLGEVAEQDADPASARDHYDQAEEVYRTLGALPHAERVDGHRRRLDPGAGPDAGRA